MKLLLQKSLFKHMSIMRKKLIWITSVMANAFVNSREFVTSNIMGATTMEQLKLAIGSWEVKLSEEDFKEFDTIHAACPNPCP